MPTPEAPFAINDSLLSLANIKVARQTPTITASLQLGDQLRKESKTIDVDEAAITNILAQHLPQDKIGRTAITFEKKSSHMLGYHKAGPVSTSEGTVHDIHIFIENKTAKNAAQVIAHEATHAADFSRLGHEKARRQYNTWGIVLCGAIGGSYGIIMNLLTSLSFHEGSSNISLYTARLAINSLVAAPIIGTQLSYILNPFELRARRAETKQPKDVEIIKLIPVRNR